MLGREGGHAAPCPPPPALGKKPESQNTPSHAERSPGCGYRGAAAPHGCPSPRCPPGVPAVCLPRSCRLRHPLMPKPRAMCHHASPGLKPKPAALSPSPVPSGHGPPRPLPGEVVSSPAGGFLMESRAGMRWVAAAWVAVLACHPLSPAPFFPFRGEKKRGGGGWGGDPSPARARAGKGAAGGDSAPPAAMTPP